MKIREKLFLLLLTIIVLFTVIFNAVVLKIFQDQMEQDKLNSVQNTLKQILVSFEYVSSDISDYVFDSLLREEIALEIQHQREDPTPLKMKLKNVTNNNAAIVDGFVSVGENMLITDNSDNKEQYQKNWQAGLFDTNKDTCWMQDAQGRLYLRRNIYQVYPYEVIGYAVFEIDTAYLRSLIGMSNIGCGQVCIIDIYGNVLLTSENATHEEPLFLQMIDQLLVGEKLKRERNYSGTSYHVIAVNSTVATEKALYAISEMELLNTFFVIRRYLYQLVVVISLFAVFLSFSISHGFTKNLRTLRRRINVITNDSNENLRLRIEKISKDEIGELANDFNRLLGRLEEVHNISIQHLKASKDAKYELLEWQYRSLQSQVSPHFLCNIMSSICLLSATGNSNAVQKVAVDASRYLRSNLSNCDKKDNSLQEEIRIIREYVSLVNAISAVPMELRVICPDALYSTRLPTCTLQPLIENSIKHGIDPIKQEKLIMTVEVMPAGGNMVSITVCDNGVGYKASALSEIERLQRELFLPMSGSGMGILGIIRRLKLMYQNYCQVQFSNLTEGGACTCLMIPLKTGCGMKE